MSNNTINIDLVLADSITQDSYGELLLLKSCTQTSYHSVDDCYTTKNIQTSVVTVQVQHA